MKKIYTIVIGTLLLVNLATLTRAQKNSWSTGVDLVSSYVWRGTKFGSGPALQPTVEFNSGGFSLGAWGSYCFTEDEALETDLYMSLAAQSGLALTLTDYYFPGASWFKGTSHFIEPMISFEKEKFSLLSAYMLNKNVSDLYMEASLSAGPVNLSLGAGDGAYTANGKFNVCNISLGTTKNIKVTELFTLPVSGTLILNPSSEQLYLVFAISL